MLIDDFLPQYDFREYHHAVCRSSLGAVRRAVQEWSPTESLAWRLLLRLRGLGRPAGTLREWAEAMGFLHLAESDDEALYGQIGRFWALNERGALVSPRSVDEFLAFQKPGHAVAVMSVRTEALADGRVRLSTETRVRCLGPGARRRFRLYWLLIRPFSGLLRRSMLAGMKKLATQLASESRIQEGSKT